MKPILPNSIDVPISNDVAQTLLSAIATKKWWQGAVISGDDLPQIEDNYSDVECWVVASQTCNLYNPSFQNVPVFELVAASSIGACHPEKVRGDNPRILHVEAMSSDGTIFLELDIQKRRWLPRSLLAGLSAPRLYIRDAERGTDPDWLKNQWKDNFSGWLGRSYTRVALPDFFNDAIKFSRVKEVLEDKLIKHKDDLYGIYLELNADSEDAWQGVLGEMPPPYLLGITLVTYETADPEKLKQLLLKSLFVDKIKDTESAGANPQKITRAQLAGRRGIRIIPAGIEAKSVSDIPLLELMKKVRYSLVDHFSDSSMAVT